MEYAIKLIILFITLFFCQHIAANDNFDRVIKSQQEREKNTQLENQVQKKDVFSSGETAKAKLILPAEDNCIKIKSLLLKGNFVNDDFIRDLHSRVSGRCLGVLGINAIAQALQDNIIRSGYITTRIEIPNQNLSSGELLLNVAAGKIERIIIENYDIRKKVLPFKESDIVNIRAIEQGLEVMQRISGNDFRIAIEPGSKKNFSNIIIRGVTRKSWNAKLWLNNWGDRSTGKLLTGGTVYVYNQAKLNDIYYLSVSGNAENVKGNYKSLSSYYSVPYGYWDYEIFYSTSESNQPLRFNSQELDYEGKSSYLSAKGSKTIYRDSNKKIATSVEVIKRKANYRLADVALVLQKRDMANVKFGVNYKQHFNGAGFSGNLSWQRFVPWLGAEYTSDMREGEVSKESNILSLDLNYVKLYSIFGRRAWYDLKMAGQYSPGKLTLQDQLSLNNRWNVRGFDNSAGIHGNKGAYVRNTLNIATGLSGLEGYIGADYGKIWGDLYPKGYYSGSSLASVTLGLKGSINTLSYDFSLSSPLAYPQGLSSDKLCSGFNINLQI